MPPLRRIRRRPRRRTPDTQRVRVPPPVRLYPRRVRRRHRIMSLRRRRRAMVRPDSVRPARIAIPRHAQRQLNRMVRRVLHDPNPDRLLEQMNRELGE